MPLDRYNENIPFVLPEKSNNIRFIILSSGRYIAIDLPISVMISEFGESQLDPLAHFETQRTVIEIAASDSFNSKSPPGDYLLMEATDFETKASRTNRVEGDWL